MTENNNGNLSVYELCLMAYKNNALESLFLGKSEYRIHNLKHIPADVPTDIGGIIDRGLYLLYDKGYSDIPNKLIDTIIKLLEGDALSIWTAYSIVWFLYWNEISNTAPFKVISIDLLKSLKSSVLSAEIELKTCKEYVGYNQPEGLWSDIWRINNNFYKKFGVKII